jgi:hypothetical protein
MSGDETTLQAPAPDGPEVQLYQIGQPAPMPPRTPEHFVCLRGPCRYYWHLVTSAQEGNPGDTWEHLGIPQPRLHHHTCLLGPEEVDFADDNAYECSRWDPLDPEEQVLVMQRRERYFTRHPEVNRG